MSKTIVCFGDSNTYGSDSTSPGGRLAMRWPKVLENILGTDYDIREEGLSGRTVATDDVMWDMDLNGIKLFLERVQPHAPVYLLIIMLGTNDVKEKFGLSAKDITDHMKQLIELAKDSQIWENEKRILLIAPTPVGDNVVGSSRMGQAFGAVSVATSKEIGSLYKNLAASMECYFIDAQDFITVGSNDYVHLSAEGHNGLGIAVADFIAANSL